MTAPAAAEKQRGIVIIFGQSGSGKTFLARYLTSRTSRLIIADTTGDFEGEGVTFTDPAAAADYLRSCRWGTFRVRLYADVGRLGLRAYRGDPTLRADRLGPQAAALGLAAGNCTVLLDELANYCTANYTPPALLTLASLGRHRRVSYVGTSRRPAEVSRTVTGEGSVICAFRLSEPIDLENMRSRLGSELAARLNRLEPRHFYLAGRPESLGYLQAPPLDTRYAHVLP